VTHVEKQTTAELLVLSEKRCYTLSKEGSSTAGSAAHEPERDVAVECLYAFVYMCLCLCSNVFVDLCLCASLVGEHQGKNLNLSEM
jgi:hypothetical protein